MRSYRYLPLLVILLGSCSLFKDTNTRLSNDHQLTANKLNFNVSEQKDWVSKSNTLVLSRDTANLRYQVQIWPKGSFSFSPEKGFSGEAGQVLIRGSTQRVLSTVAAGQSQQQEKGKTRTNLSRKQQQVTDHLEKKKISSPSIKWMLVSLIVMLAIGWYSYRKIIKINV